MKTKVQFDKDALIRFFIENGEKIAFGVVVLVFLMFAWGAYKAERYKKTPEELQKVTQDAKNKIQNADTKVTGVTVRPIIDIIRNLNKPIPAEPYQLATNWTWSIFPPSRKRTQPTLERVEKLVATPGHGRFQNATAGGNDNHPLGKRWIVLTGLVNMEKLRKSYRETFEDASGPPAPYEPDFYSKYWSFQVDRTEITGKNQDPDKLKWKTLWDAAMYPPDQIQATTGGQELPTDPNCILQPIVVSLPNRNDRAWGEEALHPPEISMIENHMGGLAPEAFPGEGDTPNVAMPGIKVGPSENNLATNELDSEKICPYALFRFFDYDVEPGKKYRYRVRLYFKNPNWGLSEDYLDPALVALQKETEKYDKATRKPKDVDPQELWRKSIVTKWSDPSKVVCMPPDGNLLLGEVNRSSAIDSEPLANITIVHWDFMKGIDILDNLGGIPRGMVVNLFDQKIPTQETENPAGAATAVQDDGKVNYITDLLVLDLKGGETLPDTRNGLRKPSTMLLFTPGGSLMTRSSIEDKKERENLENPQATSPFRGGGAMRPPRGGRMMEGD